MNREEIAAKVIELAAKQGCVAKDMVTLETHFVNDLNYDSLQMVEFTMELEDEFEMSVPDEEVTNLMTVGSVVDYVCEKIATPTA
jgi:acyl carrier protein